MNFKDFKVYAEYFFSVGIESVTSTAYLSVPVSSGFVDYEEYYAIDGKWLEQPDLHLEELRQFAEECRARKKDEYLLQQPGTNRGTAI